MEQPLGQAEGPSNSFLITERLGDSVMLVPRDPCKGDFWVRSVSFIIRGRF